MTEPNFSNACPKCASVDHVREKMLLIDKLDEERLKYHPHDRLGCGCQGDLSVDQLNPQFVRGDALQQFIAGYYCDACGIGFVPDEMAKPLAPRWQLTDDGWHPVNPDGSLGPAYERME
jgi:hypothetical protein